MCSKAIYHRTIPAMNSRCDVVCWGVDDPVFEDLASFIKQDLHRLEKVLSRFDASAEAFLFNQKLKMQNEALVSQQLFGYLSHAIAYNEKTAGYFDVFYNASSQAKPKVELDNKKLLVKSLVDNVSVDFGAIGKGIAIDRISIYLDNEEIENCLISFGESSILTRGKHPHGDYWPFSFQSASGVSNTLRLTNDCLSISGLHIGVSHIFNANTGMLSEETKTVCVQAASATEAEVLSTALIAAPRAEHKQIIENFKVTNIVYGS